MAGSYPPPRERFFVTLEVVPDPLAEPGRPGRDGGYRLRVALKRLLRDHGLRCVAVTAVEPLPQPGKAESPPAG